MVDLLLKISRVLEVFCDGVFTHKDQQSISSFL